ncbi:uncharacterized mitochondrial protein-like protein, partial [Tanacetum coccineum]
TKRQTRIARFKTIRLLIALAAEKGWKIHHLDVKMTFLNGDRKKLDSTLKEMGFLQYVHEKAVYRKVSNGEFIIIAVYGDDLFMTGTSFDLINEFKKRMASQFEILDLDELTYYLGTTLFEIEYKRGDDMRLVGYNSHNVDIDDGRSTSGHIFYPGTSPITWCSQKQTTMALSSCEAEFMAATADACQAIWLRAEVTENEQVQGDEIVTWCARVTLFESEIQGVIVGEFLKSDHGLWRGLGFSRYKLECESNSTMFT